MTHFDTVVLGAGPGGYHAAIRSAQLGMRTAIVEKQWWGGVSLNLGSIPTKSLVSSAELASLLANEAKTWGIVGQAHLDYGVAHARSRAVANRMAKGIRFLMKKNKITEYAGWGTFRGRRTLAVELDTGVVESLTFSHGVIATGATAKWLAEVEPGPRVVTYESILTVPNLPKSMVICGAGPLGVEFAYILTSFGVKVTIIEYRDRILPAEDAEVSAEVAKSYRGLGIKMMTGQVVKRITQDDEAAQVYITSPRGGAETIVEAEQVLMCVGNRPRTQGFGLENSGVELDSGGAIAVDETMQTNVTGLYAVGDVTGKTMLAHVAQAQGVIAAEAMAGVQTFPINYDMVPRATYSQPQVASFGYTEAQAKKQGHQVVVSKFPLTASGRAWGLGRTSGFIKLIIDAAHNEILGAHLVGAEVVEMLGELTLAQMWDLTASELGRNIHLHPSLSEAIGEASLGVGGGALNL